MSLKELLEIIQKCLKLFYCPLTSQLCKNPVSLITGDQYYQQSAIKNYFIENGPIDPQTKQQLRSTRLIPNKKLLGIIGYLKVIKQILQNMMPLNSDSLTKIDINRKSDKKNKKVGNNDQKSGRIYENKIIKQKVHKKSSRNIGSKSIDQSKSKTTVPLYGSQHKLKTPYYQKKRCDTNYLQKQKDCKVNKNTSNKKQTKTQQQNPQRNKNHQKKYKRTPVRQKYGKEETTKQQSINNNIKFPPKEKQDPRKKRLLTSIQKWKFQSLRLLTPPPF